MHMIFQNHIAVYLEALVVLPPDQGIEDDLHSAGAGKYGQSVEHGEGQEMRGIIICSGGAGASDGGSLDWTATQSGTIHMRCMGTRKLSGEIALP